MTEKELFNSIYPKQESSGIIYEKDLQKSFSILMGKVYLWMTLALLITGFTAYSVAQSVSLMSAMLEHPLMVFGICGAGVPKEKMIGVSQGGINLYKPYTANRHTCVIVYKKD